MILSLDFQIKDSEIFQYKEDSPGDMYVQLINQVSDYSPLSFSNLLGHSSVT